MNSHINLKRLYPGTARPGLTIWQTLWVSSFGTAIIFILWLVFIWALMTLLPSPGYGQTMSTPPIHPTTVAGEVAMSINGGPTPSEQAKAREEMAARDFSNQLDMFNMAYGKFLSRYCGWGRRGKGLLVDESGAVSCTTVVGVYDKKDWVEAKKQAMRLFGLIDPKEKGGK